MSFITVLFIHMHGSSITEKMLREEIRKTLVHELWHHMESLSGYAIWKSLTNKGTMNITNRTSIMKIDAAIKIPVLRIWLFLLISNYPILPPVNQKCYK